MTAELQLARDISIEDESEQAVTTLIRAIGEDPSRDGLLETPRRVAISCKQHS